MTTIVYNFTEKVIAYDSRITRGDVIISDDFCKMYARDNVRFFMCGATSDYDEAIECYLSKSKACSKDLDLLFLVVDKSEVFAAGCGGGEFWFSPASHNTAIGSGANFALTAMDCGLSARDAVKMAIKRDTGSGGKVNVFKIQGY